MISLDELRARQYDSSHDRAHRRAVEVRRESTKAVRSAKAKSRLEHRAIHLIESERLMFSPTIGVVTRHCEDPENPWQSGWPCGPWWSKAIEVRKAEPADIYDHWYWKDFI